MVQEDLDLPTLLAGMRDITVDAGDVIMAIYGREFKVDIKEDRSPVTEADKAAEDVILPALAKIAPDIPVISEEAFADGHRPDVGTRFFLVDPLDGTKEFISRNGEFTVNIALIDNGHPVAGVVYAPAQGRLFFGDVETGAFEQAINGGEQTPQRISVAAPAADGLIAVASRSHRDHKTEEYLNHYNIKEIVAAGSSLKLCLVATGEADIYPRHGRTMEWDIAAGHAVLSSAGGSVTKMDGSPFLYGKVEDGFANPYFVAKGKVD